MNDLEHDLRDLLETRSRESAVSPVPSPKVLKRARRRQVGTVLTATLGVVAVAFLGVVAFGSLTSRETGVPGGRPTTSTQTLNGITITYPEPWHLIDPDEAGLNGPDPTKDLPYLVLALSPRAVDEKIACPGLVEGEAPTFLMTVQEAPLAVAGDFSEPWPVALESMSPNASGSGCYPGWEFLQAGWTAAGRTFQGRVGVAPDISDQDREALFAAFDSMTFVQSEQGPASAVIASGTTGGEDWELIVSSEPGGLDLSIQGESFGMGGSSADPSSEELALVTHIFGTGAQAGRLVWGTVPASAVQVVVTYADSTRSDLPVIDVPDEIYARANAFVFEVPVDSAISVEALDADGAVVARGGSGSEQASP